MAMRINTNSTAVTAFRYLGLAQAQLQTSVERLASGLRINHAQDDPAGLAIAEKLRTQNKGLQRASMNAQDGVSLLQTAESALGEVQAMLQRIRELAIQAANGTLTSQDRAEIQREIDQLLDEIDRTAASTEFNTKKLLNGQGSALVSVDSNDLTPIITGDKVAEGNYRLEKDMTPGAAQVLKSDIFRIVKGDQYRFGDRGLMKDLQNDGTALGTGIFDTSGAPPTNGVPSAEDYTAWQDIEFTSAPDVGSVPGSTNTNQDFRIDYESVGAAPALEDIFGVADYRTRAAWSGFAITGTGVTGTLDATGGSDRAPYVSVEVTGVRAIPGTTAEGTIDGDRITIGATAPIQANQRIALRLSTYARNGDLTGQVDYELDGTQWVAPTDVLVNAGLAAYTGTTIQMGQAGTSVAVGDRLLFLYDNATQYGGAGANVVRATQNVDDTGVFTQDTTGATVAGNTRSNRTGARVNGSGVASSMAGSTSNLSLGWLDADGNVHIGTGQFRFGRSGEVTTRLGFADFNLFESTLAERTTELRWVDRFSNPTSLFDTQAQTLTMYVSGRRAQVVLEGGDSLEQATEKLRRALTDSTTMGGLGLGVDGNDTRTGVDGNVAAFVSSGIIGTDEAVPGTIILRTTMPGMDGRIFFSGDDRLIDGFSFAQVKNPTLNRLDVTVYDAHTSRLLGRQQVNDAVLRGIIAGVDVAIRQDTDVRVAWNAAQHIFDFSSDFGKAVEHVHVVDNSLNLQVGPNPGHILEARIGEVTRNGLHLNSLLVVDRDAAQEAITNVDTAITTVNSQRARIGAYVNRLNSTIRIIDIAQENMAASESRIRDLDIAQQTMSFTRDQIMTQASTAMLAQANALPQSVLQLLK